MNAFHAFVEGEVQGVGFRYSAVRRARELGLVGWVRNLDDGRVEAWAEGAGPELEAFLDWLRQGPPGAWVTALDWEPRESTGRYSLFSIGF